MSTAMDSVLAEYYGPLWEEYHIFGLYNTAEGEAERREQMVAKLKDNISYTLEPEKELSGLDSRKYTNLFDISLDQVEVCEETRLMDYQGQLFINEAVEYMKYKEVGNIVELFLDKLSLLKPSEKVSYIYEEKQKVEEQLVEIDKGVLKLMELLDGLMTSKKGIEVTKEGNLKIADYFVKKLFFGEVTKQAVGINQDEVFEALKTSYINPAFELNNLTTNLSGLEQVNSRLSDISYSLYSISNSITWEQSYLAELSAKQKKSKSDKQQISDIQQRIESLYSEMWDLNEEASRADEGRQSILSSIEASKNNVIGLFTGVKPKIIAAISTIDDILIKIRVVAPLVNQYQEILNHEKEALGEDTYNGLEESLSEMKRYIALEDSGYNFQGMKVTLERDLSILTNTEAYFRLSDSQLNYGWYQSAGSYINMAIAEIQNYSINDLTLDYSTLVLDKAGKKNPVSAVGDLLRNGLMSLVIDKASLSNKVLNQGALPSDLAAMSQENSDGITKLEDLLKTVFSGDDNLGISGIFKHFNSLTDMKAFAVEGLNKLAELLLFNEYIKEHFEMYSNNSDTHTIKPSALSYEQEYLLMGKASDQDNLSLIISKLVFLRTILDFVSLIRDSAKMKEAKAVAAALIGFTGLPILIGITQVLIMLVWSLSEALLDVSALLIGKEVPILKSKLVLELPELFMLNRSYLKEKAEALTPPKEMSFSYQDYLRLFLLMKNKEDLAYRSMDLIQENIKFRYDVKHFKMDQCIFGFKARAEFAVAPRFINMSYLKNYIKNLPDSYHFSKELYYSY